MYVFGEVSVGEVSVGEMSVSDVSGQGSPLGNLLYEKQKIYN